MGIHKQSGHMQASVVVAPKHNAPQNASVGGAI